MSEYRVVIVDGHIIAQFNSVGWYTCSKANNNDEEDFAVWQLSQGNLAKAHKLIGECKLVEAPVNYRVKQHKDSKWYIYRGEEVDLQNPYDTQNMALRNLARFL